jgi:hypothetical protein
MRLAKLLVIVASLTFAAVGHAESAKIIKVLPHFLDQKGRSSIHPSLFERDAYQAELRANSTNRAGLRFDVQWKARRHEDLTLRLEAKTGQTNNFRILTLEKPVAAGRWSRWTNLSVTGQDFQQMGNLIAWRASLVSGTNVIAEQTSFLW